VWHVGVRVVLGIWIHVCTLKWDIVLHLVWRSGMGLEGWLERGLKGRLKVGMVIEWQLLRHVCVDEGLGGERLSWMFGCG